MAISKDSVPVGRVALFVRTTARELDSPAAEPTSGTLSGLRVLVCDVRTAVSVARCVVWLASNHEESTKQKMYASKQLI